MPRTKKAARPAAARRIRLLIATRKGLWTLTSDLARNAWKLAGPHFLGHTVHHVIGDLRDGKTLLAAARTGHLGPTVFRSLDNGKTWKEAAKPPAFTEGGGRVVDHTFWLTPGHASESGTWYAGTSPQGLFRSVDGGATWEGVAGFNQHPKRKAWCGGDQDGTPDGPKLHSILVDPRDPKHLYVGMSSGGVFESTDAGGDWRPLNQGVRADFQPDPIASTATTRTACGWRRPSGPALPAESLRHLPHRPAQRPLAGDRRHDAEGGRLRGLSDGRASPRSGHAVGVPDGRHVRVAAHVAWRAPAVYRSATAAARGSARTRDCRKRRPGGR
jgi:photosystem II stability/assembly factor-like uncharacterized protein